MAAICDLFNNAATSEDKELLGHTMFLSLAFIMQQPNNEIFKKYLEIATGQLKLATLNEMIQENRDNPRVYEPLLKSILILGTHLQGTDENSCNDILNLLRSKVKSLETEGNGELLKVCICCIRELRKFFPVA